LNIIFYGLKIKIFLEKYNFINWPITYNNIEYYTLRLKDKNLFLEKQNFNILPLIYNNLEYYILRLKDKNIFLENYFLK